MELFFRQVGTGRPIIIVHGLFGSSDNWLTLSKQIADQGYAVFTIDQRNHGRSPHTATHTYQDMASDLHQFIVQQNLSDVVLVGHSMGGKSVMQTVLSYPDLVAALVVADIAPKYYPVHHTTILEGLNAIPLASIQSRQEAEEILNNYEKIPAVKQFLLKNLYRNEEGNFAWRINLPLLTKDIEAVGEAIESNEPFMKPTLFVYGQKSHYVLPTDRQQIEAVFPLVQLEGIANAGHWLHAEQPQAFLEILLIFLRQNQL